VARQNVDTLNIIVTDSDIAPRMVNHLDMMIPHILSLLETVGFVTYYEFLQEFIKIFAKVINGDKICSILNACVVRICQDI